MDDFKNDRSPSKTSDASSFLDNVISYFHEYCNCSSIHGCRYFGEKRTLLEKIWWLVVFILCIVGLSFSIRAVYNKWDKSPVIVSFATKAVPIYTIPFPAVTICSEAKVNQNVFNYSRALTMKMNNATLNETDERMLSHLQYICPHENGVEFNETDNESIFETLEQVTPKFSLRNCKFIGLSTFCGDYIKPIITDEGICYTFNMLTRTELLSDSVVQYGDYHDLNSTADNWNIEHGYDEKANISAYPLRALLPGARYGLQLEIKSSKDLIDHQCRGSLNGFRVLFHSAIRLPRLNLEYVRVDLDTSVTIVVHPSMISTSDSVKAYDAKKRMCYFPSERSLKYFKSYSASNCQMECLTNFTLGYCNCIIFYMPRENGTRICGGSDYECTRNAEYIMHLTMLVKKIEKKTLIENVENTCSCFPICSDINYDVSVSQTTWDWPSEMESGFSNIDHDNNDTNTFHLTRLSIYFAKSAFIASERNELYGPTDFLANFGGLLGLFTGFSILSLMEIIYFLTLRLAANKKLFGFWAGPKN